MRINVPQDELEVMLDQWKKVQGGEPEFRLPKCWRCGRDIFGSCWHVFFRRDEREAHLCMECGGKYAVQS